VEALPEIDAEIAAFPQLGYSDPVTSITFSPDGKQIVSVGDNTAAENPHAHS
jgi:WD40 repeat protein